MHIILLLVNKLLMNATCRTQLRRYRTGLPGSLVLLLICLFLCLLTLFLLQIHCWKLWKNICAWIKLSERQSRLTRGAHSTLVFFVWILCTCDCWFTFFLHNYFSLSLSQLILKFFSAKVGLLLWENFSLVFFLLEKEFLN